jgi:hypothetical protein
MAIPVPKTLPGDFFVVAHDEDDGFTVYLDDEASSSYRIGPVQEAMTQMKIWGVGYQFASRALDYAREFKSPVQCIESENRTISLRDRKDTRSLVWEENEQQAGWVHSV